MTGYAGRSEPVDVVVVGLGGLGSATAWQLARRGVSVVGLEKFELGHLRGASHDTSRILRRSYHTPAYVRLAGEAYDDWADLERVSGERLVTVTGGVDLFPPGAAIPADDYAASMVAGGVPFEQLDAAGVVRRWPALRVPEGTVALQQDDTAIVPAGRSTATMARLALEAGAQLHDRSPVTALVPEDDGTVTVVAGRSFRARRVVLTADAWTNELLAHLGTSLPLTVTREQVTYFAPPDPTAFGPHRLPVWIWMDDPSFYGFPTYAEGGNGALVKAGQDCGGAVTTGDERSFDPDPDALGLLSSFAEPLLPGLGAPARTVTCLYTLTPDRDFVAGPLPAYPSVLVGLGAGHGFKFAPTFGRVLADLALDGETSSDIAAFAVDRPALAEAGHPVSWLV
jgi:sarcosine oxidase